MDEPARGDGAVSEAAAWTILAYLISGPTFYGLLGWAADRWLGTEPVFVLIGIVGGMAAAVYVVWVRYGAHKRPTAEKSSSADDE